MRLFTKTHPASVWSKREVMGERSCLDAVKAKHASYDAKIHSNKKHTLVSSGDAITGSLADEW